MKPLSTLQFEILRTVAMNDWMSFRDIVWEFNGPRETTFQMDAIKKALDGLCRRRILESATASDRRMVNVEGGGRLYRRRAETKKDPQKRA